ncbi:hypothetical protein [Frankia sp. ACN1ag]|uniref:hypothetical protein n=1 Tax=Frankia sp. ACN1ag TaxID=102891 RepID=UPI0006DBDF74|nr:hypothetical protein [Frankia sp. ACN1ag]KQC34986.1 hypothetical protein UK82_29100 [Frankia sp. ACN1ag]
MSAPTIALLAVATLTVVLSALAGAAAGILHRLAGAPWPQVLLSSARGGLATLGVLTAVAGVLVAVWGP